MRAGSVQASAPVASQAYRLLLSESRIRIIANAAPGLFYGPAGANHVRVALTATDERVAAAAARLTG